MSDHLERKPLTNPASGLLTFSNCGLNVYVDGFTTKNEMPLLWDGRLAEYAEREA